MENVAEYSTMPRALRGANSRSVMMELNGLFGSSSPKDVAAQSLIRAGTPESLALKGRGVALFNDDADDARIRGRDQQRGCEEREESPCHEDYGMTRTMSADLHLAGGGRSSICSFGPDC